MSADKRPHGPSRSSKERQYGAVLRPPVMEEREPWSSRSSSASRHSPLRYAASHEYSSESSGVLAYHPSSVNYDSPTASQSVAGDQFKRQWTKVRRVSGTCRSRVPRGAGSFLVFLLNVIESLAFYGALDSILRALLNGSSGFETGVILLVQYTAGRLLYPVAGFLADVYFGRYRMIHIGVWLFWIAFALLALSLSIASGIARDDTRLTTIILPIIAFVLISAGSSAIEVTIIPFGVDQLSQGASSEEQSSYFYWYYFGRQLGVLVGISTFYGISLLNIESGYHNNLFATGSIQSLEALAGMTLALILLWWFNTCLFKDKQRENPLKLVINILYYTATVKERGPIKRRAFRYGEGKKSRIERAKFQYDGLYTSEEVEDVKTFCKILLILFSLGLCFMTYTGVYSMLAYRVSTVYKVQLTLFPNILRLWNVVTILVVLPILNFVIIPCTPSSTMRERIGFGLALITFSSVVMAYLEWCVLPGISSQHQFLWLLLPAVCVSIGEALLFVTGLEFIYAQSPEQMKGLLTGLFYLTFGLFSGAATLFFLHYPKTSDSHVYGWYFVIYSAVGIVGFVMYVTVACLYSNRVRPEEEDYD